MKTTREIVRAIIASFDYNRSREDMIKLCEEVKKRIRKYIVEWTDDGNILYGILVLLYGDYGTSPRSGWLESDTEEIIASINEEIELLKKESEVRNG